jgi:purine-binding chemotaxis protein CheW
MADNESDNLENVANEDLQKALAAAFGAEAVDWDDIAQSDDALLSVPEEKAVKNSITAGNSDAVANANSALEELLKRVSSAIDDGVTPEMLSQADSETDGQSTDEDGEAIDLGPRHVVFEIGDQQFGLPLTGVLEIDRCGDITSLPRTPNWLRGVTNLRGQILSVTDFRNLMNLTTDRQAMGEKIIVVNSKRHAATTAVVVDRVLGIRHLSGERGPLSGLSDRVANFSDGIAVTDQATTVLIDPDLLLGCGELQAFSKQ